jgi:hypothetical protein
MGPSVLVLNRVASHSHSLTGEMSADVEKRLSGHQYQFQPAGMNCRMAAQAPFDSLQVSYVEL